jgi:hypothetical protein
MGAEEGISKYKRIKSRKQDKQNFTKTYFTKIIARKLPVYKVSNTFN